MEPFLHKATLMRFWRRFLHGFDFNFWPKLTSLHSGQICRIFKTCHFSNMVSGVAFCIEEL